MSAVKWTTCPYCGRHNDEPCSDPSCLRDEMDALRFELAEVRTKSTRLLAVGEEMLALLIELTGSIAPVGVVGRSIARWRKALSVNP